MRFLERRGGPASDPLVPEPSPGPRGGIGVQSAKLCVASDADREGRYTDESCISSSL